MSAFSIRLARPEDAEALPGIEREAATAFADDPDSAAIDSARVIPADEHRRLIARGHCLVAEAQGDIVGFLAARPCGSARASLPRPGPIRAERDLWLLRFPGWTRASD